MWTEVHWHNNKIIHTFQCLYKFQILQAYAFRLTLLLELQCFWLFLQSITLFHDPKRTEFVSELHWQATCVSIQSSLNSTVDIYTLNDKCFIRYNFVNGYIHLLVHFNSMECVHTYLVGTKLILYDGKTNKIVQITLLLQKWWPNKSILF